MLYCSRVTFLSFWHAVHERRLFHNDTMMRRAEFEDQNALYIDSSPKDCIRNALVFSSSTQPSRPSTATMLCTLSTLLSHLEVLTSWLESSTSGQSYEPGRCPSTLLEASRPLPLVPVQVVSLMYPLRMLCAVYCVRIINHARGIHSLLQPRPGDGCCQG